MIDAEGKQLGVMQPRDAIKLAEEHSLDLVEVAPQANPPVCRIMDYGKYQYQMSKRAQEARRHQKSVQVKEVKFRPRTDEHDYQFKKNHIVRFLSEGNKAKATVMFRGREMAHTEIGRRLLQRLIEELKEMADIEKEPKLEGYNMSSVFMPKKARSAVKGERSSEAKNPQRSQETV